MCAILLIYVRETITLRTNGSSLFTGSSQSQSQSESIPWNESKVNVVQTMLEKKPELTDDDMRLLLFKLEEQVELFIKSHKYAALIKMIVTKYKEQVSCY